MGAGQHFTDQMSKGREGDVIPNNKLPQDTARSPSHGKRACIALNWYDKGGGHFIRGFLNFRGNLFVALREIS